MHTATRNVYTLVYILWFWTKKKVKVRNCNRMYSHAENRKCLYTSTKYILIGIGTVFVIEVKVWTTNSGFGAYPRISVIDHISRLYLDSRSSITFHGYISVINHINHISRIYLGHRSHFTDIYISVIDHISHIIDFFLPRAQIQSCLLDILLEVISCLEPFEFRLYMKIQSRRRLQQVLDSGGSRGETSRPLSWTQIHFGF